MARQASRSKPVSTMDGPLPLLRLEDVARRLSVSRSFAWKLLASGALPCVRIGRAVRCRPEDLEAYIERATGAER